MRSLFFLPAAAFVVLTAALPRVGRAEPASFGDKVQFRGSLTNSRVCFEQRKKATVAFMGGSITEMNGYRPMVCERLKKRFPQTEFKFVDAGISSTCSTTGAFRLASDVFAQGPVDLFFVEFAVNDDQDAAHTRAECIRGMEGIIRHARQLNPNIDIVMTFFVNEGMLKTLQSGQTPLTIEAHETVAKHEAVSTINLAKEAAEEITAGKLTWKQYGGVHPAPYGNAIGASMIDELFDRAWAAPLPPGQALVAHPVPQPPLDPLSYTKARFIDPKEAHIISGWTLGVPDWKALSGGKRDRFTKIPRLCATEAGADATLDFEGTTIGAFVVAGPDAGEVLVRIDGGRSQLINVYHNYSSGLHYPRSVILGTDLSEGHHTIKLHMADQTKHTGHAMRIIQFEAN